MSENSCPSIALESLHVGIPALTTAFANFYKENCMVCLDNQGHSPGVLIEVKHSDYAHVFEVQWVGDVTDHMRNAYTDLIKATDHAACAFALLIVREITEFTAVVPSAIGSTIDYYLAPDSQENTLIFNHAARLEVSGILVENENNSIQKRIRAKQRRLRTEEGLRDFIFVVAFNIPRAEMAES